MSPAEYLEWLKNAAITIALLFAVSAIGFLLVAFLRCVWRDIFGNDKEKG